MVVRDSDRLEGSILRWGGKQGDFIATFLFSSIIAAAKIIFIFTPFSLYNTRSSLPIYYQSTHLSNLSIHLYLSTTASSSIAIAISRLVFLDCYIAAAVYSCCCCCCLYIFPSPVRCLSVVSLSVYFYLLLYTCACVTFLACVCDEPGAIYVINIIIVITQGRPTLGSARGG